MYYFFFDPYNVFLAIATSMPQRLKTGFVVQGHICESQGPSLWCYNIVFELNYYLVKCQNSLKNIYA